jgi:hypothetical protein
MPSNRTRPDYSIELSPGRAVDVQLGTGVDMSDPLFPRLRGRPFQGPPVPEAQELRDTDLTALRIEVDDVTHVRQETYRLAATASIRMGITSAEAAYERARYELETYDIQYIDARYEGEGDSLPSPEWTVEPEAESTPSDSRLQQFLHDFGSHYVRRVVYGFAVTMRLAREKSKTEDRETFRGAVRAIASSWGGGASIESEHTRVIEDGHTNVLCTIVAGRITPPQARLVTRWQDIGALLASVRTGQTTIHLGPLRAEAQSYFHTLASYQNCRELFMERPTMPAPTPFGVPAGTIIAWYPSAERGDVEIDTAARTARIIAPEGWALCDGTNGTPDLRDRFVLGTLAYERLGGLGGSISHVHEFQGETSESIGARPSDPGYVTGLGSHQHRHSFRFSTQPTNHLPPHAACVFIMRL